MNGLLALCDHGVHDAHRILKGAGYAVEVMTPETKLNDKLDVVLVVSVSKFLAKAEELTNWEGVVILFDSPVRCDSLMGLTMVDVKERTESFKYVFERIEPAVLIKAVSDCISAGEEVMYHTRKSNLIPYLLNQTSNSQMDRILTWKYTIKDVELRDSASNLIITWFFAAKPTVDQLREKLGKLIKTDKAKALEALFKDTKLGELKQAVQELKVAKDAGKAYAVDKIADKHKVSPFDIRYLVNAYSKMKTAFSSEEGLKLEDIQRAGRLKKPCPLKEAEDELDTSTP